MGVCGGRSGAAGDKPPAWPPGEELGGGGKPPVELDDGGKPPVWPRGDDGGKPPVWPAGGGKPPSFGCQHFLAFGATLLSLVNSAPSTLNISGMSNESKSKPMSNAA